MGPSLPIGETKPRKLYLQIYLDIQKPGLLTDYRRIKKEQIIYLINYNLVNPSRWGLK